MLVFDIETIPILEDSLSQKQKDYLTKKLNQAFKRDPTIDLEAKSGELRGTDPYLGRIICIGMYWPQKAKALSLTNPDEKTILQTFWSLLVGETGPFIGYNTLKFDIPFIIRRSMHHGITPTSPAFLQYTKYDPTPVHYDMMLVLSGGRENYYSLHEACDFFGVPSPKEGGIVAAEVATFYHAGKIQEIADYCLRDVQSTYDLYQKAKPFYTK
jgi:predicted PolB exonuclease-like 3'-5' exonuclease